MSDISVQCRVCQESFSVPSKVLESRVIDTCMKCFRGSTIKLHQDTLLFRPDFVIENIFIGGYRCAESLELIRENNITHVLVCGDDLECPFKGHGITYLKFELEDEESQSISQCFEPAHEFILESKRAATPGGVLVHCYAGVSRSATIVISYLMKHHRMSYSEARKYLRSKRPCICPNPGFSRQLMEYEMLLIEK